MRKTKIICTLGPTSENKEVLGKLIQEGMNAARLNFSHGTHEEHEKRIKLVKELREECNKPIAIILDTKGPEIRTGTFKNGIAELREGAEFTVICGENIEGDDTRCSVSYAELYKDVKPGNMILIADGLVGLEILQIEGNIIHCIVRNSGTLGNQKNVNVPGISVNLPAITKKDIDDLKFGVEQDIDMISASFIRKASDVLEIRKVLAEYGGNDILIFSKIENQEGVNNIDEIIKFSDGVMVARGDLGVEIPTEDVPLVQKMIIDKCNEAGKPVITATQMLDSMIRNPRPTRAEASDVANAIFDGTDVIMLSGETANGKYPVETVRIMAKIAERTEESIKYRENFQNRNKKRIPNVPSAISLATCNAALDLNASAIITATQSGHTARMVSRFRPECPIIAVTPYKKVARRLALNWGVYPLIAGKTASTDELINNSVSEALDAGLVNKGDLVVIAAGIPVDYAGTTNMLKVHIVGDILVQGKGKGNKPGYGVAHVIQNYDEEADNIDNGDVLVAKNLDNRCKDMLDKINGIVTEAADFPSEIAIEILKREIPIIYNAADATSILKTGAFITVDAQRGIVYSGKVTIK